MRGLMAGPDWAALIVTTADSFAETLRKLAQERDAKRSQRWNVAKNFMRLMVVAESFVRLKESNFTPMREMHPALSEFITGMISVRLPRTLPESPWKRENDSAAIEVN